MSVGENLKRIRKEKDLTQEELGKLCGMSAAMIRQYELGYRKPKSENLKKIALALECEVSDIDENFYVLPPRSPERIERLKSGAEAMAIYKKKASGKNITLEEQQKIDAYTARIIDKYNQKERDNVSLSYENSYSYASSEEEFNKLQKEPQIESEKKKSKPYKDSDVYIDPDLQKLYETAMQKAIHHEELTEEEEQVIIGIPGQMRHKGDSYEDSFSFTSSEEGLNKILKQRQKQGEELLLSDYRKLNKIGQSEARKRMSELTEIPRYTAPDPDDAPQD